MRTVPPPVGRDTPILAMPRPSLALTLTCRTPGTAPSHAMIETPSPPTTFGTTAPEASVISRKRPFGIYVIAALQALNALATGLRAVGVVNTPEVGGVDDAFSGSLAVLMMLAGLVAAAGLVQLKRWAWVAMMLWVGLNLAAELGFYFNGKETNYLVLVVSIAQCFYLNLSDVQAAFERQREIRSPLPVDGRLPSSEAAEG
jgi:hypothetical protein